MAKNGLVKSPAEPIAQPPKGYRGSHAGEYNGEKGYLPKRTTSKDGVPEVTRDGTSPKQS